MINLTTFATELQVRINALTNASGLDLIVDVALTARKAEVVGINLNRTVLDAQLQRITNTLGAGSALEDFLGIAASVQRENSGYPVGTVIDNYLGTNDVDSPSWINLGTNVVADLNEFPKLANLSTQGALTFTAMTDNNLPQLLAAQEGTWKMCCWRVLNNIHFVLAVADGNNYYRCFTSTDGILFFEKGHAPTGNTPGHTQSTMYFLNDKYFIVSPNGVIESANAGADWVRRTPNYYYSMGFHNGLYIFGSTNDEIYTTTDFVTITKRFNNEDGGPITNIGFMKGRLFAFKFSGSPQFKLRHSVNGVDWTALTINAFTHTGNLGYCHAQLFNDKIIYMSDTSRATLQSDDGVNNWTRVPTIASQSFYANATIVAGDTLYGRGVFTTDTNKQPRISNGTTFDVYQKDGQYIYCGSIVSQAILQINRFPITANASKVYLPNLANKMMKVK